MKENPYQEFMHESEQILEGFSPEQGSEIVGRQNEQEFPGLWTKNPSTGEMMINPLFVTQMSAVEIKNLLDGWMEKNPMSDDDVTVMVVELDKYFKG